MTRIHCIFCDTARQVELDDIDQGQFVTCRKCEQRFNVFGIYKFLYNGVTLARRVVDTLSSAVYVPFRFEGGKEKELDMVERFRKDIGLDSLLNDVVFDTVLYGNSFLEKVDKEKGFLRRVDPTSMEVVTSWQRRPPWKSHSLEIEKLVEHLPAEREIHRSDLIHIAWNAISSPIGLSVLGFWFDDWYSVVFGKKSKLAEMKESTIIGASGVPYYLIHPEVAYRNRVVRKWEEKLFSGRIRMRRNSISRVVGREILPLVLNRPFNRKDYPRLKFT